MRSKVICRTFVVYTIFKQQKNGLSISQKKYLNNEINQAQTICDSSTKPFLAEINVVLEDVM